MLLRKFKVSFKLLELTREFLDKFNVDNDILEEQECKYANTILYDCMS